MGISVISYKKKIDTTKYKEGVCRVGFFSNSRYENDVPVAFVGYCNEFGVPHGSGTRIPPRPFMRPALHQNKAKIIAELRSKYRQALKDNKDTMTVLNAIGEKVKGLIQEQILNTWEPRNAPSTIKRKGVDAPLRDTKVMLHSVAHQEQEIKK